MLEHLKKQLEIEDFVVAQEDHEDGSKHLHVWLKLAKKINLKRADKFDLVVEDTTYHPNIQAPRSNECVIKYVTKDDNFISSKPKETLLMQ